MLFPVFSSIIIFDPIISIIAYLSTKFEVFGKYKNTAIAAIKATDNKQQNLEKNILFNYYI